MNLESAFVPVMYRVNQAEYAIHIRVAAPGEYVNTYLKHMLQTEHHMYIYVCVCVCVCVCIYIYIYR